MAPTAVTKKRKKRFGITFVRNACFRDRSLRSAEIYQWRPLLRKKEREERKRNDRAGRK